MKQGDQNERKKKTNQWNKFSKKKMKHKYKRKMEMKRI
jgi:hypothetical protein